MSEAEEIAVGLGLGEGEGLGVSEGAGVGETFLTTTGEDLASGSKSPKVVCSSSESGFGLGWGDSLGRFLKDSLAFSRAKLLPKSNPAPPKTNRRITPPIWAFSRFLKIKRFILVNSKFKRSIEFDYSRRKSHFWMV